MPWIPDSNDRKPDLFIIIVTLFNWNGKVRPDVPILTKNSAVLSLEPGINFSGGL